MAEPAETPSDHVGRVAALFDSVAPEYDQHVPLFSAFAERLIAWSGAVRAKLCWTSAPGEGPLRLPHELLARPSSLSTFRRRCCAGWIRPASRLTRAPSEVRDIRPCHRRLLHPPPSGSRGRAS